MAQAGEGRIIEMGVPATRLESCGEPFCLAALNDYEFHAFAPLSVEQCLFSRSANVRWVKP